jgi:hypothetical protein
VDHAAQAAHHQQPGLLRNIVDRLRT